MGLYPKNLPSPNHRGMTLIELMVAVSIMVIMIMGFGLILTASQRVVSTSQSAFRSNATAEAITRAIRHDLNNIKPGDYLCILSGSSDSPGSSPILFHKPAGAPVHSMTHNLAGSTYLLSYGLKTNRNAAITSADRLLLRRRIVDVPGADAGPNWDCWNIPDIYSRLDFYNYSLFPFANDFYDSMTGVPDTKYNNWNLNPDTNWNDQVDPIGIPAQNPNDVARLWQVLASEVNGLSIMWWDGSKWCGVLSSDNSNELSGLAHSVRWSGGTNKSPYYPLELIPVTPSLQAPAISALSQNNMIEFSPGGGGYFAMWGPNQSSRFPEAIRISFRITDPTLEEGNDSIRSRYYTYTSTSGGVTRTHKVYYTRYEVVVRIK